MLLKFRSFFSIKSVDLFVGQKYLKNLDFSLTFNIQFTGIHSDEMSEDIEIVVIDDSDVEVNKNDQDKSR